MERKVDFFRDEVRNGFYIPAVIKQAWAETLSVLDEIDRICEKPHYVYMKINRLILIELLSSGFEKASKTQQFFGKR